MWQVPLIDKGRQIPNQITKCFQLQEFIHSSIANIDLFVPTRHTGMKLDERCIYKHTIIF